MDVRSLDDLLKDGKDWPFWLKPIGPPRDTPEWGQEEHREWTESVLTIHFAKNPVKVSIGAIIIAYRIRYKKLIYIAQRLPMEVGEGDLGLSEYWRRRFPFHIKGRNLTPEYGRVWKQFDLQPFSLANEYNRTDPNDPVSLGAIQRGNDKARIPRKFAELMIRRIQALA